MSTNIRPEISKKSKYWIDRHRYYELKHFCLQYPYWKRLYNSLDGIAKPPDYGTALSKNRDHGNPVEKCVEARLFLDKRMGMIEKVAKSTSECLAQYIFKAVTEGIAYEHLRTKFELPCSKAVYYETYRRFFWLLSKERQ